MGGWFRWLGTCSCNCATGFKRVLPELCVLLSISVVAAGDTSAASLVPDIFKATDAAKARPLAAKLEILLDLMFRRICYDPTDPANTEWSTDRVMRVLKKQDKDLGN